MRCFPHIFASILIAAALCNAAILHVPGDYPTIQAAVDAALSGDEIVVEAGIYQPVYVDSIYNLTFTGAGILEPYKTIIDGNNSERGFVAEYCDKLIIHGFEIRNCYQECLHVKYCSEVYILDNYLHDCNDGLGNSLAITVCEGVLVKRNIIVEAYEHSFYIDALYSSPTGEWSKNIKVINNTIGYTGTGGSVGGSGMVQSWSDTGFVYINNINVFNSDYGLWYKFGVQSSFSEIKYSDHYGNNWGPWGGCYPTYDSTCIYMDPQFVGGTGAEQYMLLPTSPCIDTGDPEYLDPDSTRSDIGALPYMEGNIDELLIDLIPYHVPIIIPAQGGEFRYGVEVRNESLGQVYFDLWLTLILPNGYETGPFVLRQDQFLPGYGYMLRHPIMNISPMAMAGVYTMMGYVGYYPNYVANRDSFTFEKEDWTDEIVPGDPKWSISGWGETEYFEVPISATQPENYEMVLNASPNPFNPETTISFDLPQAGIMSLKIYDITGREVAVLYDGYALPGTKEFRWNANNLPSGIYFAQLETNKEQRIKRILLIK